MEFNKWMVAMKANRRQEYAAPNAKEFEGRWKAWWYSVQPSWRSEKRKWPLPRRGVKRELCRLNVPGQQGLFIAVATLSLWGAKVGPDTTGNGAFEQATNDVSWVFSQIKRQAS